MAMDYAYDPSLNIVYARPHGEHSSPDVFDYFKKLVNDEEIQRGFVDVVNFEDVDRLLVDSKEGDRITEMHNALRAEKNVRATVFISNSDLTYGIARMMQILHELNDPAYDVFVVRSEEEADHIIRKIISERPT